MATPDIGTSISDGYSTGLDKLTAWIAPIAVVAGIAGVIAGVSTQVQITLVPDAADVFGAVLRGENALSSTEFRTVTLVSAVSTSLQMLLTLTAYALFAGLLHRERHGGVVEVPGAGATVAALLAALGRIAPKVYLLAGLVLLAQAMGALLGALGGLLGFLLYMYILYLNVRWIYAWVIGGSGEMSGDRAFERSEQVVDGSWWGTFGTFIVIGLATLLPVTILGMIVGGILPGAFLTAFGSAAVSTALGVPLFGAALESAWSQVEAEAPGIGDDERAPGTDVSSDDEPPTSSGPFL